MKKLMSFLSIILVLTLCLNQVPLYANDEEFETLESSTLSNADQNGQKMKERYTVLVLDESGSMRGKPIEAMKKAAKTFCKSVLESGEKNQKNHIAIVTYGSQAKVLLDFTDDLQSLNQAIDGMKAWGETNISEGLDFADRLLKKIPKPEGVDKLQIKNVLLLSDGYPTAGLKDSTGPYSNEDFYYKSYMNGVYSTAQELSKNGYNIYTLGFFHSLNEFEALFTRKLMKDIQNKGYYDVVDPDKLEFKFGEIAGEILNQDPPIVIVPGVMGSRLFNSNETFDDSTIIWPPHDLASVWRLRKLKDAELFVRAPENQVNAEQREYGAQDTYKNIVDKLCDKFPERKIYVFSYDWTKDNEDTADRLKEFLDGLEDEKVDLVCHSMGGLIASRYYTKNISSNKINKIITAGTPYEGAPKLINAVLNWDVLEPGTAFNFQDNILGLIGGMTKDVKASLVSLAQLTPTENYITKLPMWKDSWKPFGWGDYQLTYDQYLEICKRIFKSNFEKAIEFHKNLHLSNSYNELLYFDNAYFAIGINQPTISAIKFKWASDGVDELMYEDDLSYEMKGDGTVPYLSASIMEQVKKLPAERVCSFDTDHTGVIGAHNESNSSLDKGADKSVEWIIGILEGSIESEGDSLNEEGFIVIRIACPVDVEISMDGKTLNSDTKNLSTISPYGRLDFVGKNDEVKMLCLRERDYHLLIDGTGQGSMDYTIRSFASDGSLKEECKVEDVPINEETLIQTSTDFNKEMSLSIDRDGDGAVDQQVALQSEDKKENPQIHDENVSQSSSSIVSNPDAEEPAVKLSDLALPLSGQDEFFAFLNGKQSKIKLAPDGSVLVKESDIEGLSAPIFLKIPMNDTGFSHVGVLFRDGAEKILPFSRPGSMIMWIKEAGKYGVKENQKNYSDTEGHWAEDAITFVSARVIMSGTGEGRFEPNAKVTRAMFAKMLANLEGADLSQYRDTKFKDLPSNAWYLPSVEWAVEQKLFQGYGNETFAPNNLMTREQMAKVLDNYLSYKMISLEKNSAEDFRDESEISEWAKESVKHMKEYKLLSGMEEGKFKPKSHATRAQLAQVLKNLIEAYVR